MWRDLVNFITRNRADISLLSLQNRTAPNNSIIKCSFYNKCPPVKDYYDLINYEFSQVYIFAVNDHERNIFSVFMFILSDYRELIVFCP